MFQEGGKSKKARKSLIYGLLVLLDRYYSGDAGIHSFPLINAYTSNSDTF